MIWRGEAGALPPVAAPGSEAIAVNYLPPNVGKDSIGAVASGPIDRSLAESGAFDIAHFDGETKAESTVKGISASLKAALARYQNAATEAERHAAFADIVKERRET